MAEPSSHINFSFEDIQRYLQGKMSATEMHDIEKAALEDPFLADAIEGFNEVDFSIARQHLNEINAGLFAKKKESKVVAFNKRAQWLNVAAVVIVLAGIGLVASYFFRSPSIQQAEVAKVQQDPVKNEEAKDSATTIDDANALPQKPDTNVLIAANKAVKKVYPPRKKTAENIAADKTIVKDDEPGVLNAEAATLAAAPPTEEKNMMARSLAVPDTSAYLQGKVSGVSVLPSLPSTFSGKVLDENGEPIAGVTITSADKKAAVITDMNGNFNLEKTDSLLNVTASTVGYDSRTLALKKGINDPIILNQANEALSEVVVTGYGTQRKKNTYVTDSLLRNQKNMGGDSAMPVGGWNNFNHYVITQLNSDTTTNTINNPDDVVEMEFLIDKAGNPYDIKVTRAVNEQLSSKAVEILKNGPKWTNPARKKKAHVTINF